MSDNYFFDSSTLVKYYLDEIGSDWVTQIIEHNDVYIAAITGVEVVSAIHKKKRSNEITQIEAKNAIAAFKGHLADSYNRQGIEQAILDNAQILVELHSLRAYDSVQLAVAIDLERERQGNGLPNLIFVSGDDKLNEAAKAEGLFVENPNNH